MNLATIVSAITLMRKAFGRYKFKILVMAGSGFVGGLMGGIGIGAIIPLFSFVLKNQNTSTDTISKVITKFFAITHLQYNLVTLMVLMAALFVGKALFLYIANYITARITAGYEKETRNDLFKKTLTANWPYLLEQKIGHLETILVTDVTRSGGILDLASNIILISMSLLAYSIVALSISAPITLITLGIGIVLFFILRPLLRKIRNVSKIWATNSKIVANQVAEYTIGTKVIKAAGVEEDILAKIQKSFRELREARIKLAIYYNLQTSFQEPLSLLLVTGLFAFSYLRPDFQFTSFVAVIYLVQKMFSFMQAIQGRIGGIYETMPFLRTVVEYDEKTSKEREEGVHRMENLDFKQSLVFDTVNFSYSKGAETLRNVSFQVKKGEIVGLIGQSGAGKTTVVDLILKLFRPNLGRILIDGKDIQSINTKTWRNHIGYVSQEIFLLNDTIENNIRFYGPAVSHDDIITAAKMANVYEVIQELPDKFSTITGERGVKLSGGQRQRIVLARALARKPDLLVLDEATSALDNESEALIQKALENLKGKITTVIIAHRLSSVMICDRLIVLEEGRVVEEGTPQELLQDKNSYFSKTYSLSQNLKE